MSDQSSRTPNKVTAGTRPAPLPEGWAEKRDAYARTGKLPPILPLPPESKYAPIWERFCAEINALQWRELVESARQDWLRDPMVGGKRLSFEQFVVDQLTSWVGGEAITKARFEAALASPVVAGEVVEELRAAYVAKADGRDWPGPEYIYEHQYRLRSEHDDAQSGVAETRSLDLPAKTRHKVGPASKGRPKRKRRSRSEGVDATDKRADVMNAVAEFTDENGLGPTRTELVKGRRNRDRKWVTGKVDYIEGSIDQLVAAGHLVVLSGKHEVTESGKAAWDT